MTTDFAVLSPEVNSGRMYVGAGSAPMVAAAAAWDRLAATLTSAAQSYRAVIAELTDGSWRGPSAAAMAAAAEPYLAWMSATAAQAAQTANQARVTAAGYEAAFAATVPPVAVSANRVELANLVNANVFGQNTGAIAANQADYGEMWAQDATAMHAYAAHSAAAAPELGSFTAPPQTVNPAAAGTQAGAATPAWLTDLLNTDNPILDFLNSDPVQAFFTLFPVVDPFFGGVTNQILLAGLMEIAAGAGVVAAISGAQTFAGVTGAVPAFAASSVSEGARQFTLAGSHTLGFGISGELSSGGGGTSAGLGRAMQVGGLSVPPSWNAATPQAIRLAGAASPVTSFAGSPGGGMAGPWLGGVPPVGSMVNAPRNSSPRGYPDSTLEVIPRLAREGGGRGVRYQATQTPTGGPDQVSTLTENELRELEELREAMAELTERRDAAARSIREAIR